MCSHIRAYVQAPTRSHSSEKSQRAAAIFFSACEKKLFMCFLCAACVRRLGGCVCVRQNTRSCVGQQHLTPDPAWQPVHLGDAITKQDRQRFFFFLHSVQSKQEVRQRGGSHSVQTLLRCTNRRQGSWELLSAHLGCFTGDSHQEHRENNQKSFMSRVHSRRRGDKGRLAPGA